MEVEREGYAARRIEAGNYAEHLVPHGKLGWALQSDSVVTQKLSFEHELVCHLHHRTGRPEALVTFGWR
jgi:hypothetical protein